ncbi:MAG: c-type cytochrome [Acidobacteriota bacterium]|nr:c-type cytochrome [Acidobacteriota bacterium]
MRVHSAPVGIFTIAAALVAMAIIGTPARAGQQNGQAAPAKRAGQQGPPTEAEMAGKTAGQFYKNIKVLNDVPADKLHDGMEYITASLGVRCEFCHVEDNFPADQKRPKATARKMMTMLFAIDKDNFNGRTEVSCFTCHQGHEKPMGAALPAEAAESAPEMLMPRAKPMQPPAGTKIPTLNEILANYAEALGGQKALDAVTSRVLDVQRSGEEQNRPPVSQEISEGAPNKLLIVTHFGQRTFRTGYNGSEVWQGSPRGSRALYGLQALLPPREAQLNPVASLGQYKQMRLMAMAQIGDQQAWVVSGLAPDGTGERFFFDTKTGLLVRRMIVYRTIFGPLLFQADYSDYRKQDGVAIPYKTEWWAGGRGFTDTVTSVKTNAPVNSAEFEPPAKGAESAPSGTR